ncbi:MAG: thiamine pyrophosphate-binding protein [Alphaproteobacteria bacterium]
MSRSTGSRHIAEMFKGYGVDHVFFVPAVLMQALAEIEQAGIKRIMTHSEKAAAYMADGYARAGRRPGICMAQNIGASNLAAGLRDARMAGIPVIAMTGGPSPRSRYRNQYQEIEDSAQFEPVTKFNARVDQIDRLTDLLRQAFRAATTGMPGPVHLQFSGPLGEIAEQQADFQVSVDARHARVPPFRPAPDAEQIAHAAGLLRAARRPVIVAGGGCTISRAGPEIVALAERLGIPVATSLNGKGAIPETHPLSLGVVGTYSRECANRAVAGADLVVFAGSRTGSQVTNNWTTPAPQARVVHIDIDPAEIGRNYPRTAAVLGDAKVALGALLRALKRKTPPATGRWLAQIETMKRAWRRMEAPQLNSDAVPIRPERVCAAISAVLPKDGIVVADTGHSGMWTSTMIELRHAGQQYFRCAGSLGWSFPAALGVKCAEPDKPVVCFNGDGAFYYHLAELETAARHGINVVTVVNNNSAFNQEIHLVDLAYRNLPAARPHDLWKFADIDFAGIARSFGCVGIRVDHPSQLEDALVEGLRARRPVVIDVVTDVNAMARHAWQPPKR